MLRNVPGLLACIFTFTACLSASEIKGKIIDPSGAPVSGAQIAVVNRVGVVAQTTAAPNGSFQLDAPESPDTRLVVTAPGFSTRTLPLDQAASVQLEIAPRDRFRAGGGLHHRNPRHPAGVQRGRDSQQPRALQQRALCHGSAALRSRRGIQSIRRPRRRDQPVPARRQRQSEPGGNRRRPREFDSAAELRFRPHPQRSGGPHRYRPRRAIRRLRFLRQFRRHRFRDAPPGAAPQLNLLAEGGSHSERRFAITGTGTIAGFGLLVSASRYDSDGLVLNDDYRNEDVLLNLTRRFGRHSLSLHGYFDSNEVGEPGPWGSNPAHIFTGIDTVSRAKNNFSEYGAHYEADLSPRVRQELFGSFFLYNSGFLSQYGFSFNKDLRGQGEARTIVSLSRHDTASFGVTGGHESVTEQLHHRCRLLHFSDRAERNRRLRREPLRGGRPPLPQRRRARRVLPHGRDSHRRLSPVRPSRRAIFRA